MISMENDIKSSIADSEYFMGSKVAYRRPRDAYAAQLFGSHLGTEVCQVTEFVVNGPSMEKYFRLLSIFGTHSLTFVTLLTGRNEPRVLHYLSTYTAIVSSINRAPFDRADIR